MIVLLLILIFSLRYEAADLFQYYNRSMEAVVKENFRDLMKTNAIKSLNQPRVIVPTSENNPFMEVNSKYFRAKQSTRINLPLDWLMNPYYTGRVYPIRQRYRVYKDKQYEFLIPEYGYDPRNFR